jgi:dethiobiotin synthetase
MTNARIFITATGTSSGKTFVARGIAAALRRGGHRVAALKPLETGCAPHPLDAIALAKAAGNSELADDADFYRVAPPLSPYAATLTGAPAPNFETLVARIEVIARQSDRLIVEGAGGLLVPLDRNRDMADLAIALTCPLVIVAPNRLGVLSHARATVESAHSRNLQVAALVLTEPDQEPDPSSTTNLQILQERFAIPLVSFPYCHDDDSALADAVNAIGLLKTLRF